MLPARTKVIMAVGSSVGVAAGILTYLASRSIPHALLAAGAATGSSADLIRQLIGADPDRPANNHDDGYDGVEHNRT